MLAQRDIGCFQRSGYWKIRIIAAPILLLFFLSEGMAQTVEVNSTFASEIITSLEKIDELNTQFSELSVALTDLASELNKANPLSEEVMGGFEAIESAQLDTDDIILSVNIFKFVEKNGIFTIEEDNLDACISREAYAGSLGAAALSMQQLIDAVQERSETFIALDTQIDAQKTSYQNNIETLEAISNLGFLSSAEEEKISDISESFENLLNSVGEKTDMLEERLAEQMPALIERRDRAQTLFDEFKSSPQACYHMLLATWEAPLPNNQKLVMCITSQDEFSISGRTFAIRSNGAATPSRNWTGNTTASTVTINYDGFPGQPVEYSLENGGASTGKICGKISTNSVGCLVRGISTVCN